MTSRMARIASSSTTAPPRRAGRTVSGVAATNSSRLIVPKATSHRITLTQPAEPPTNTAIAAVSAQNLVSSVSVRNSLWITYQNSATETPAVIVSGMKTHWSAAENVAMVSSCGENSPVGRVVAP